jgi:hypothetical protein
MADPFQPIRQALLADAQVVALVSDRVMPLTKPQAGSDPSITFQLVDLTPETHLQGHADLDGARVQVEYWANSYDTAKDLADKGRSAIAAADRVLVFETRDYDFEVKLYRFAQDFLVWV